MKNSQKSPKLRTTHKLHGFTLVELIVIITILVILGTIGFIQLGGFQSSARDSTRISNLTNLKKGLDFIQIKSGVYPLPDDKISIIASGTIIGYQGFAKDQVASIAKLSPRATMDPSDKTIYTTYSVNLAQTKMQAMVFLEDSGTLKTFSPELITKATASTTSDYSTRYPTTIGDSLGILLGNSGADTGKPIQEIQSIVVSGSLDIAAITDSHKVYFDNNIIGIGIGSIIQTAFFYNSSIYNMAPFTCGSSTIRDADGNIYNTISMVGGTQCWMSTNLHTTKKPDGSAVLKGPSTLGSTAWAMDSGLYSCPSNSTYTGEDCSGSNRYGFLYQWSAAMNVASGSIADGGQGICPTHWHVPRDIELKALVESQGGVGCEGTGSTIWYCPGSPYTTPPFAGSRLTGGNAWSGGLLTSSSGFGASGFNIEPAGTRDIDGNYYGSRTSLWSSTTFDNSKAVRRYFNIAMPGVRYYYSDKAYGFSVRCLKD